MLLHKRSKEIIFKKSKSAFSELWRLIKDLRFVSLFLGPQVQHIEVPRSRIGASAASPHHSYSNMGSKPCLPPTPQLMEMLDP